MTSKSFLNREYYGRRFLIVNFYLQIAVLCPVTLISNNLGWFRDERHDHWEKIKIKNHIQIYFSIHIYILYDSHFTGSAGHRIANIAQEPLAHHIHHHFLSCGWVPFC